MWKRLLVLVLFLFGVFWWLTHRDEAPEVADNNDAEVSETVDADSEDESDEEEDEESDDQEDTEESEAVDSSDGTATATTTTTSPTTSVPATVATPKPVEQVVQPVAPVVTAPVVVTPPAPAPEPVPAVTTNVTVYLYEWGLDMSQKTLPAGTINFTVKNSGRRTHEFAIRDVDNLGKVTPNTTQTFTAQLRPGTYEVFSPRGDDYERGVADMIVVE